MSAYIGGVVSHLVEQNEEHTFRLFCIFQQYTMIAAAPSVTAISTATNSNN